MPTTDKRFDAYIAKANPFAQPILTHIRSVVHSACPDVVETMKWSSPSFMYKDQMLCQMSAFKEHVGFGFWKGKMIDGLKLGGSSEGAGHFGRIKTVKDLPGKRELTGYIKQAMKLNDEGVSPARVVKKKPALAVPAELTAALEKNKKAKATFEAFPPSHRREYSEWITEAKREETRAARVKQAVEWIAEGKARNWKYQR
jgi:uncharacterized protein YdeI (YjbR/CyaY-like superfamily)